MTRITPRHRRRGVILLVILGLLVMFMLIGVSFVMMAGASYRGARAAAKAELIGDSPDALLKSAMLQVVRGTNNDRSVAGPYSLLEGIYGDSETVVGVIDTSAVVTGGQIVTISMPSGSALISPLGSFGPDRQPARANINESLKSSYAYKTYGDTIIDDVDEFLNLQNPGESWDDAYLGSSVDSQSPLANNTEIYDYYTKFQSEEYFAGCVLTMIDGPAAMQSARILRWYKDSNGKWVMAFRLFANGTLPQPRNRFVINGRPFNGGGTGYDPLSGQTTLADNSTNWESTYWPLWPQVRDSFPNGVPFWLIPNPTDFHFRKFLAGALTNSSTSEPLHRGDRDVDYTAPDLNNMMLAGRMWYQPATTTLTSPRWQVRMPSLHRPELANFWINKLPSGSSLWDDQYVDLRRKILLRPDPKDQNPKWDKTMPDFTGKVLADDWAINGPWDVDNDGDGTADSIWVDLGMPVQNAADGRRYKPLFAVMVLDLDGRFNINAHGAPWHATFANGSSGVYSPPQSATDDEWLSYGASRIRLNAHINEPLFSSTNPGGPFAGTINTSGWVTNNFSSAVTTALDPIQSVMGIGMGFGPADINLSPVLPHPRLSNESGSSIERHNPLRWIYSGRYENMGGSGTTTDYFGSSQRPTLTGRFGDGHINDATTPGRPAQTINSAPSQFLTMPSAGMSARGIPITGDDNFPAAPSRYINGFVSKPSGTNYLLAGNAYTDQSLYETTTFGTNYVYNPTLTRSQRIGSYGSPSDMFGRAVLGMDFRGNPVYSHLVGFNGTGWTPIDDLVDEPYEINLFSDGQRRFVETGPDGIPWTADDSNPSVARYIIDVDTPFTPAELERLLRPNDPDNRPQRDRMRVFGLITSSNSGTAAPLNSPIDITDYNSSMYQGNKPTLIPRVAQPSALLTTESWDVPVPGFVATPEIRSGLQALSLSTDNLSFADLLRGKIALETGITSQNLINQSLAAMIVPRNANYCVVPMEIMQGLRMDLNRPFGNSGDDPTRSIVLVAPSTPPTNPDDLFSKMGVAFTTTVSFNDVVDEAQESDVDFNESTVGTGPLTNDQIQPLWLPDTNHPKSDLDRSGGFDERSKWYTSSWSPSPGTQARTEAGSSFGSMSGPTNANTAITDKDARQIYAKQLYMLMMLVSDTASTFTAINAGDPAVAGGDGQRRLKAYRIAQWAINAVDFRDSDAIMTPFEFDIYPFTDEVAQRGGTWDVDGIVGFGSSDDNDIYRGLVWGMEYPELLITETMATHDKRLADTNKATVATGSDYKTTDSPPNKDNDFDQVRHPQGSAFIELYCTGRFNGYANELNQNSAIADDKLRFLPRELYNVRTPIPEFGTSTLSAPELKYGGLDLSRMDNNNMGVNPVWRLYITPVHRGRDQNQPTVRQRLYDPLSMEDYQPDSLSLQTEHMNRFIPHQSGDTDDYPDNAADARFVWFCNIAPTATSSSTISNTYYNQRPLPTTSPTTPLSSTSTDSRFLLMPGRYAVVGPARTPSTASANVHLTTFGSRKQLTNSSWQPQGIDLNCTLSFPVTNSTPLSGQYSETGLAKREDPSANYIRTPLGIPVGKTVATAPAGMQGLNISEPLNGYTSSMQVKPSTNTNLPGPDFDGYLTEIIDAPVDNDSGTGSVLRQTSMTHSGTYVDVRTVFLQRLANPLMPWNPVPTDRRHNKMFAVNPYITVDWSPIDLTVFNGISVWPEIPAQGDTPTEVEAETPAPPSSPAQHYYVDQTTTKYLNDSRERGPRFGTDRGSDWPDPNSSQQVPRPLWAAISDDPRPPGTNSSPIRNNIPQEIRGMASDEFPLITYQDTSIPQGAWRHRFRHTLGYLNRSYGIPLNKIDFYDLTTVSNVESNVLAEYVGSPKKPFPLLTWNNRPYANAMELLLVPASSPQRFTTEFTYRKEARTQNPPLAQDYKGSIKPKLWGDWGLSGYTLNGNAGPPHTLYAPPTNPPTESFGYLLNFFAQDGKLGRIFELVHVPSRFSGTEELLYGYYSNQFGAPFNRVSRYREPGKINLNTMFDAWADQSFTPDTDAVNNRAPLNRLWAGLTNYFPNHRTTWKLFLEQRGDMYPEMTNQQLLDPNAPTFFRNPFRSYLRDPGGPLPKMSERLGGVDQNDRYRTEDAGLLRRRAPNASVPDDISLLTVDTVDTTFREYRDYTTSPYFRYQQLIKIGNSVTNRSNVYAIWITMGMFEVEPVDTLANGFDAHLSAIANPDGYRIVREMGTDSGDVRRYRSFGIFDRSIPVGFNRGWNLNVDRAFLINRIID